MAMKIFGWLSLLSVTTISLCGFSFYLSFILFLFSFFCGILTVIYITYDEGKIFKRDLSQLDNPLDETSFSVRIPKILEIFQDDKPLPKFDQRITGSENVDTFLNEIINIIIADYVTPWYEILTDDDEFKTYSLRRTVIGAGVNISNRVKMVDWIQLLSTRIPEELTSHLKLFKQARARFKQIQTAQSNKESPSNSNTRLSPKRYVNEKPTHRRNKSDTDVEWFIDNIDNTKTFGKSKFYSSTDSLDGKTMKDIFFNLECIMEDRLLCRDIYCQDPEKEYALLCEVSEAILYLVAPEDVWKCHPMKLILIELLSSVVMKPLLQLLSDPDNINRLIVRMCSRDSGLPTDLFMTVIRCSDDAEELDATLELVQKEIQKLHSRDTVGECELPIRQQLSSLQYLTRVVKTRRASLGSQEGLISRSDSAGRLFESENLKKETELIERSLKFLSATNSWRCNMQNLIEIEMSEPESSQNSRELLRNLRTSALELCDIYLAPNKPQMVGVPENSYTDLVRKITTENDEFDTNPPGCFDDVQKSIFDALEEMPLWQGNYAENEYIDSNLSENFTVKEDKKKYGGNTNLLSVGSRHSRSHSDVGTKEQEKKSHELANLKASIIETALVQEKGKTFGIYAISVRRYSDNEEWHIYRRYSDFHDLHSNIKEKWPELSRLAFPGKKTFQNTSRSLLEKRKVMLNSYLQNLTELAKERRYSAMLSENYLGGFLNRQNQSDRQGNSIDIVNSLRAGMRTLKNMPDQFANTVDGVMDGISKVFQGKSDTSFYADGIKPVSSTDSQDDSDDSISLRLLEEILGLRGLWLRRRLLAPLRTILGDRINKKVLEMVSSVTSPRNIVQYLKYIKQWLTSRSNADATVRDAATKARTRIAAKVALLAACSDDLRHIVGSDASRRGILTLFELFQHQEINKRLVYILLEVITTNLFPENNFQEIFKRLYSISPKVQPLKRTVTAV